jgi:cell division transport system ATP-binding protein
MIGWLKRRPTVESPDLSSLPPSVDSVLEETESAVCPYSAESLVSLRHVAYHYPNGTQPLIDISLEVKRGAFLLITGSSGAGKTTLLKLLYGAERPSQGEVLVEGQNPALLQGDRLARFRRRLGIAFQDYKLIPRRTVAENIAMVLWAQGYSRREVKRRLEPTLKMIGLQDKANAFPRQLSGGEQQRVSLGRAMVATPPILLVDEPTGNLDSENSLRVLQILKKLNSHGVTILVTTHDDQLIRRAEHPVLQLLEGKLYEVIH